MTIELKLKVGPDVNSRFSIHDIARLAPGICFICGSDGGDDRKFVDFGKQFKWYGAVYFCSHCIREVAEAVGFFPAEVMQLLVVANEEFSKENAILKKEHGDLRESLRTLSGALSNCSCSSSWNNDSDVVPDVEVDESDPQPEPNDTKPVKSRSVKGSVSIPDAGDDK